MVILSGDYYRRLLQWLPNDIISHAAAAQPLTVTNATAADWKTASLHELYAYQCACKL